MTRWILGLQFVVVTLTAILFASRFDSGLWLGVFSILAGLAAAPLAATVGGWVLGRRRLAAATDASERMVDVVGLIHADVVRLRAGTADASVREVAVGILDEAVFPAVFGTVGTTAEGLLGPLGFLARRATRAPLELVERTVTGAITSLPDRKLGDLLDGTADAVAGLDVAQSVAEDYTAARDRVTSVVERVARTSGVVAVGLTVVSVVPLIVWWLFGWIVT